MIQRYNLLGVQVSVINLTQAYTAIIQWIKSGEQTYVCVAPVSTIVDCQRDPVYKAIINKAGIVTPDGMPVVWMGRVKGHKAIERTYGPDLMRMTCDLGQKESLKHYIYGATEATNQILISTLKENYPKIQIAGVHAPGMLEVDAHEEEEVIERINQANPDIVWVGLGSPKQDYWMRNHREKLQAPVLVGVGAAFDFIAGIKPQAPKWMQQGGLEWVFRLGSEPRRLWKRYLVGNSVFVYLIFKEAVKGLFKQHD